MLKDTALIFTIVFISSCLSLGKKTPQASQGSKKDGVVQVAVNLSSHGYDIAFDQKSLQVPFGYEVILTYKNHAAKDSEISHNIVIIAPGEKDRVFKVLQKADYKLSAVKDMKGILAMSKELPPGGTDKISFKPKAKGFYHYACLMPGHGDVLGMTGIIQVK